MVIFTFTSCVLAAILYRISFRTSEPYEGVYSKVQQAAALSDSLVAITLGNSHAGSIDFEVLGFRSSAYSLHGGFFDPFEIAYLGNYVIPQLEKLEIIFIPIPHYFFFFDNGAMPEDAYQTSFRRRTYFMTPQWKLITDDPKNLLAAKFSPLFRPDKWKGVIAPVFEKLLSERITKRPITPSLVNKKRLEEHARGRTEQQLRQVSTMTANHDHLSQEAYQTMLELIELLVNRGIEVVLFTPSYYEAYDRLYTFDHRAENRKLLRKLLDQVEVTYFDWSKDESMLRDSTIYTDSDHYNEKGRRLFSEKLRDSLVTNGLMHE